MRLSHLTLRTTQPGRILSFYRAVLHVEVERREDDGGTLSLADGQRLFVEQAGETGPGVQLWLRTGPNTLARVRRRLTDLDVEVVDDTPHRVVFVDPDGRRVALHTARGGAEAQPED